MATRIYPDPANEQITVAMEANAVRFTRLEVIDMSGRVVLRPTPPQGVVERFDVDVRRLEPGRYLLRSIWDTGSSEQRFSVIR